MDTRESERYMRIAIFDWIKVVLKVFIIVTHVALITSQIRQDYLFPFWIDQAVPPFWIISSFLLAWSFERHGSTRASHEMRVGILGNRMMRVAVPYTVVFIPMLVLAVHRGSLTGLASSLVGVDESIFNEITSIAALWLAGGPGPGGYYVPILFQMYLLLPVMYAAFRRKPVAVAVLVLLLNIGWDALLAGGFLTSQAYRLLIFRYLVYLLLGMVFYRLWSMKKMSFSTCRIFIALLCCAMGAAYLALVNYCGMPPLAGGEWANTSWITALYSGSIFYLLLEVYCRKQRKQKSDVKAPKTITQLSKAALHVYLFQMLYFFFINAHLSSLSILPLWAVVAGSVFICVAMGVMLYSLEKSVRRSLRGGTFYHRLSDSAL